MYRKLKLTVRCESESASKTIEWIDIHYTRLNFPMKECEAYYRGNYFVVQHTATGCVIDYEHCMPKGHMGYLQDAISVLQWRGDTELLGTLRMAIREDRVQGCGVIVDTLCDSSGKLRQDNTLKQIKNFIRRARHNDIVHHGERTF